jgi:DNA (cytosine-5)-methyltransferase 1
VLAKHWPGVKIYDDVRTIDTSELPRIDLLHGGYPCQPFSLAGKRGGHADERHLWPAMLEVVRSTKPTWVVGENVAGHITLGLDDVLDDLEAEGYETRTFVFQAFAVGAKHGRERCFVVAYAEGERCGDGDVSSDKRKADRAKYTPSNYCRAFGRMEAGGWAPEPRICRVAHGIPDRVDRLRSLGNAVIPQQAYPIFAAIAETYNVEVTGVPYLSARPATEGSEVDCRVRGGRV